MNSHLTVLCWPQKQVHHFYEYKLGISRIWLEKVSVSLLKENKFNMCTLGCKKQWKGGELVCWCYTIKGRAMVENEAYIVGKIGRSVWCLVLRWSQLWHDRKRNMSVWRAFVHQCYHIKSIGRSENLGKMKFLGDYDCFLAQVKPSRCPLLKKGMTA